MPNELIDEIEKALEAVPEEIYVVYDSIDGEDHYPLNMINSREWDIEEDILLPNTNAAFLLGNSKVWLRALLEENKRLREEDSWKAISEITQRELQQTREELSAKDKVLEDFANGDPYATKHKARSILSQYKGDPT